MHGWRVLAIGVGVALFAGCGGSDDESSGTVAPTSSVATTNQTTVPESAPTSQSGDAGSIPLPDAVGMDLQAAQDTMQAAGFYDLTSHDATGQGRNQVLDRNWTVCDQVPAAGSPTAPDATIDFGAVKDDETCPP